MMAAVPKKKASLDPERFKESELYRPIREGVGRYTSVYHIENMVMSDNGIPDLRILSGGFTFDLELKVARFRRGRGGELCADFKHWRESQKRYVKEVMTIGDPSSCWMLIACSGEHKGVYVLDSGSQRVLWESLDRNRLTVAMLEKNATKSFVRDGPVTTLEFSKNIGKTINSIVKMKRERVEAPF